MSERYCWHCHNTGELDCYCGGDLCICHNNGTYPCPHCDGGALLDDDYDDLEDERNSPATPSDKENAG